MKNIADAPAAEAWRAYLSGQALTPVQKTQAGRFALSALEQALPGHSVEVRVPFVGAVQILRGTKHRRGTPPAVVEMSVETWLALAAGSLSWDQAEQDGLVDASGERADLSRYLPISA